ncbi:hypothetical protein B0H19DRAFT_1085501 [Mycena capillaripes]|nr:hypothetical protein B0H19DRAFT_1085501 [Mycena capillaripes]
MPKGDEPPRQMGYNKPVEAAVTVRIHENANKAPNTGGCTQSLEYGKIESQITWMREKACRAPNTGGCTQSLEYGKIESQIKWMHEKACRAPNTGMWQDLNSGDARKCTQRPKYERMHAESQIREVAHRASNSRDVRECMQSTNNGRMDQAEVHPGTCAVKYGRNKAEPAPSRGIREFAVATGSHPVAVAYLVAGCVMYDVAPLDPCFFTTSTHIPLHYVGFNARKMAKQDGILPVEPAGSQQPDSDEDSNYNKNDNDAEGDSTEKDSDIIHPATRSATATGTACPISHRVAPGGYRKLY